MVTGLQVFMDPVGGYRIGYLISAVLAGMFAHSKKERSYLFPILVGLVCQYTLGMIQLSYFVGINKVFFLGCAPFLMGDLFKIACALTILKFLKPKS
jgi:biotin transport system substrate-specific component